ncbi:MAG: hypothetical protein ABIA63_02800 [bacterium]
MTDITREKYKRLMAEIDELEERITDLESEAGSSCGGSCQIAS